MSEEGAVGGLSGGPACQLLRLRLLPIDGSYFLSSRAWAQVSSWLATCTAPW